MIAKKLQEGIEIFFDVDGTLFNDQSIITVLHKLKYINP